MRIADSLNISSIMFDEINQLRITDVLSKLGIRFSISGDIICLDDHEGMTKGRRGSESKNFVNDFSGKGRAIGGPYSFVKSYLGLSGKETFKRFKENFSL